MRPFGCESGWGFNIVQHGSGIIFATWFIYDSDGRPVWLVMPQGQWSANGDTYQGPIYRKSGPAFCLPGEMCSSPDFDPSKVTRTLVGQGTISINAMRFDGAIIAMTVDGKTLTRSVRRQSF